MEWINAKEARHKAQFTIGDKTQKELETAFSLIEKAIDDGKFEVCDEGLILGNQAVDKLRELGYDVKFDSHRNESYTTIKW